MMVADGFSTLKIKIYLSRWALWWVGTSQTWTYDDILTVFIEACWQESLAIYAKALLTEHRAKLEELAQPPKMNSQSLQQKAVATAKYV